jgi:putative ABC transport system substrate-binding protein
MRAALILLLLLAPASAFAAQVLVVVSQPLSPSYREALEGLRAEFTGTFEIASADRALPPGPHGVIVALGGRAASRARQAGSPLIVALAPSYRAEAATILVAMTPSPERFVSFLAAAGVRRLLAVRAAPADPEFVRRVADAGKLAGVAIDDEILQSPEDLPRLLRGAGERADAVWLAPDPTAVTPETFGVVREYARARSVPFFAPAAGLVMDEVRGEITVSFRDCGRAAARAAQEILAGRSVAKVVYPGAAAQEKQIALSTAPAVGRSTVSEQNR